MSDGWIAMPLSALAFALQLAESRTQAHSQWVEVDALAPLEIDLDEEVSVQMFVTELLAPMTEYFELAS